MKSRHFSNITRYCTAQYNTINNIRCFSNLDAAVLNDDIQKFPEKKVTGVKQQGNVYVKNLEVANSIASSIAKEWNGGYLFEANAGPGILTSSLLQKGIKHLRVFERNKEFLPALKILKVNYPALEIVEQDLMMTPSFEFKKNYNQSSYVKDYFNSTFKNIPVHSWEKETSFQIFAVIANKRSHKFLRYLLAALPNQATPFSFGRCDFFLLISETEFMCMNALPKENFTMYRWSTVLYNLFFDLKCLNKFPADSDNFNFCKGGWFKKMKQAPYFYLIKLTPKSDIFKDPMTPEKLLEFFFFVRSNLTKRSDLVIKTIEGWMPFCGPRLIKEDFNVFMRFGDISPTKIFQLFNCISSCSEYKCCYSKNLGFFKKVPFPGECQINPRFYRDFHTLTSQ